jgi:alpha-D-ribose 1-methylphosphonate 5-triphosphate synthase subunit PhnG
MNHAQAFSQNAAKKSSQTVDATPEIANRQHWMSVLARADLNDLETYWQNLPNRPNFRHLRKPEIGMAMVRGRTGGTGSPFNLGEITLTRCVVELAGGAQGFGYVTGRSRRHAELAALLDGMMCENSSRHRSELIQPLHEQWLARRHEASRKAATTKVNFMTMVRGS